MAITIRLSDGNDRVEQSPRERVQISEYSDRLSADLLALSEPAEVSARIESALGEIATMTGAQMVDVVMEHHDPELLERLMRWTTPEYRVGTDEPTVSPRLAPAEVDAVLDAPTTRYGLEQVAPVAVFGTAEQVTPVSLLSAPLVIGEQRGVMRLMRCRPGPRWTEADAGLATAVSTIISRALRTHRSERLLGLLYQDGPLGFSIRTWDGKMLDCNRRYLELFHLTRTEADHRDLSDVISPADQELVAGHLRDLQQGSTDRYVLTLQIVRRDGTRFWARTTTMPLQAAGSTEKLLVTSVEDVTEIHDHRVHLEHAVRHDMLTGVANRVAMSEVVDQLALQHGRLPSLMIIDLDRFKLVNDQLGHAAGDEVLRCVAERIAARTRPADLVARLGGDEFAIIVPEIDAENLRDLAGRVMETVSAPMHVEQRTIEQSISIGIAIGDEAASASELMVCADRALYAAKDRGRNGYVMFDESLQHEVLERLELEADLRRALERGELHVHYQPEYSISTGRILGVEALIRWQHPWRGQIPASEFVTIAEESGLIEDLGRFVLAEASSSFAELTAGTGRDDLVLRVNLSAREFRRDDLTDLVLEALDESGLDPSRLCLEMTETTLMDEPDRALVTFDRLRRIGVKAAIDDFGTGYSSLSYLKKFPVDAVKIDRTFIEDVSSDPHSRAIVETILRLAETMDLEVVGEGVETDEQLAILQRLGCDRAQGFLFARPMPSADLAELLSAADTHV